MSSRVQLTLFASGASAEKIEEARRSLDPVQFKLIPAHVTLCREDELEGLPSEVLWERLSKCDAGPISLTFGAPQSFSTHGILLPCIFGEEEFQALRHRVLGSTSVRRQVPHITLAHPRNPKAAGNSLAAASVLEAGMNVMFKSLCFIQQDGNSPWRVVERFELAVAG